MQTRPVQVYRITARDALPPPHSFRDDDDARGDIGGRDISTGRASASAVAIVKGEDVVIGSDSTAVSKETSGRGSSGVGGIESMGRDGAVYGVSRSGVKFEKVRQDGRARVIDYYVLLSLTSTDPGIDFCFTFEREKLLSVGARYNDC